MRRKTMPEKKYRFTKKFKRIIIWTVCVIISVIFIESGSRYFKSRTSVFSSDGVYVERAVVTAIGEETSSSYNTGESSSYDSSCLYFNARITSGEFKDETVLCVQVFDNLTEVSEKKVEKGDKVILYNYGMPEQGADWVFAFYSRLDGIIVLTALFFASLLFFGRIKGFNTIVSLTFTCLAVFKVFIPAVLSGASPYFWAVITCLYTIPMTLLITQGFTEKSLTTILGCTSGVFVAAVFSLILDKALKLTGMLDEHTLYLTYFDPPVNLHGLIFSMIVIGAMGAVMDVAMDISSSLHEIREKRPDLSFSELYKSGLTIGRDIMGTMANTLVLAYIGSSLCSVLLMISYSVNLRELLNREGIIVEMLNGITGSFAILLTIPLTALICSFVYKNRGKH